LGYDWDTRETTDIKLIATYYFILEAIKLLKALNATYHRYLGRQSWHADMTCYVNTSFLQLFENVCCWKDIAESALPTGKLERIWHKGHKGEYFTEREDKRKYLALKDMYI
jgi:hypothetical protein